MEAGHRLLHRARQGQPARDRPHAGQDDVRPAVSRRVHLRAVDAGEPRALPADPAQADGPAPPHGGRARSAHRGRQARRAHHVEHSLDRSRRDSHANGARRPARPGRDAGSETGAGELDHHARAVAEPRRRRHRRRSLPRHARLGGRGQRSAGPLPLLRGPRQQPRLVRVHAARDAVHGGLAVHAVGSADQQRHSPAGRRTRVGSSSRRTWIRSSRTSTPSSPPGRTR